MSFDSSRFTFDPWNNFSGVLMEQGRVQLDSDWNEWLAEFVRRIRAGTLDTFGHAVVPATTPTAFQIGLSQDSSGNVSISIGPGRMYVDGLQAENHGLPAPNALKWIPASGPAQTATTAVARVGSNPIVRFAAGQVWDSAMDELEGQAPVGYDQQPYYRNAAGFPQTGGPYLIYLDVWQREVTFLEDPNLVEKAVGVDTTGRLQTAWQVKWLDLGSVSGVNCATLDANLTLAWKNLLLPPGPRLTTGVVQSSASGPCCLTPNTGYTGQENQLYRVEIHQAGNPISSGVSTPISPAPAGTATFKWSRDNASVATSVTGVTQGGKVLAVASTGKDDVLRFSPNDWVEITDDYLELNGLPGELHKVSGVDDVAKTITLSSAVSPASFPVNATGQTVPARHTRLTRWDQDGKVFEGDGATVWVDLDAAGSTGDIPVPPNGTTLILENGITVSFDLVANARLFNPGDNWVFAARTADGTVEFLSIEPPRGIYHHYARLSVASLSSVSLSGTGTIQDQSQPPVTFLTFQTKDPTAWLANFAVSTQANALNPANFDLEVLYNPTASQGVTLPVTVESFSNISLNPAASNYAPVVIKASKFVSVPATYVPPTKTPIFAATFPAGTPLASTGTFNLNDTSSPPIAFLTLQITPPSGWPANFAVSASPSGTDGNLNLEVVYATAGGGSFATVERFQNLALSMIGGGQVTSQFITNLATPLPASFPPLNLISLSDCRTFWPPASTQISPTLHVNAINWFNDTVMALSTFLQDLQVTLDGPFNPNTVTSSTMIVTVELPVLTTAGPAQMLNSQIIAGIPVVKTGTNVIVWTPPAGFNIPNLSGQGQVRVRVTLKGHFIWGKSSTGLSYLDGQAFGQPGGVSANGNATTSLVLPSGNGARASDFESWFWLVQGSPLQFTVFAGTPLVLRGEGLTEEVADIVFSGIGGIPTPPGTPVPTVNITVTMATVGVTSRLLGITIPSLQDAVLLIDEPGFPAGAGKLNTFPATPAPIGVGGSTGLDFKDGQAPNIITGQFSPSVPNAVTFLGVPVNPPGTGTRILRITNLRVNASALAVASGVPPQIIAAISVSDLRVLPISGSTTLTLGTAQPSFSALAVNPGAGIFTINPSAGVNPALVTNPAATGAINVLLQFTGNIPGGFKPRTAKQSFSPGAPYTAEETFDGTGLPLVANAPPLNQSIGRADQGTQFVARFQNVPPNVKVFVTTRDLPSGGLIGGNPDTPPAQAILVFPQGIAGTTPGGVPLGTGGRTSGTLAGIPLEVLSLQSNPAGGSSGEAIWEWVEPPPLGSVVQTPHFGVILAMPQSGATPGPQTATVLLSLGPISAVGVASPSDPIPRFKDNAQAQSVFTVT